MDIDGIKKKLQGCKPSLRKEYGVKTIGVFGSYVRGEETKSSDVDVLVEFDKSPGMFKFLELEGYLGSVLNAKVDLVTKTALKPRIGKQILQEVVYL